MSTMDVGNFLKALDTLKQDFVCGVCGALCKEPVTLSCCFHLICGEHFEGLKTCPTCSEPLAGCKTYKDDRLQACIDSTKEIDNMFASFRTASNVLGTSTRDADASGAENMSTRSNKIEKQNKPEKLDSTIASNVSSASKANAKRNQKGETALHIACRLGREERARQLLAAGASANTKDHAGWTPLHEAAQAGRAPLVRLLLRHRALVDVPALDNETPLHEAVRYGHKDIIQELVTHGADINARNSKGETPLSLATDELKKVLIDAAENIVQTQGANVTMLSELHTELDSDDIRVYCVSAFRTVHNKLKLLSKHHPNLHIETKYTKKVTHLIVDTEDDLICMTSLDVLQGIVYGNWIISSQWLTKSTPDKLEPFKDFEVAGVGSPACNGPKNSRYNKYKQLPGIFDGCHFYLHNFNTKYEISKSVVLTKAILSKLITDAGGIVLRRVPNPELIPDAEKLIPYHAKKDGKLAICSHYIIFKDMYEPMYNMKHFKALPVGWLIDCIEKYELCDP